MTTQIDKKTIQKRRMMGYFIDAAKQIIDEAGIETVSAREVADIAGYNGATLYNYFDDLDHLVFYASLRYLKEYVEDIKNYTKGAKTPVERYFGVWECFCNHAFCRPKIYNAIFFEKYSTSLNHDIKEYYSIFPEELGDQEDDIKPMLLGQNIYERNLTLLQPCIKKGYVKEEHANALNEMIILVFQGLLTRFIKGQVSYSPEEATQKTLFYIRQVFLSFGIAIE
ncbi:MAG TPA: TetR/AcrR family transcriptional regulator [Clostridia bacterium]|nr:TetR/AcrR family transcriptional regulator [Clostridia bacterium]